MSLTSALNLAVIFKGQVLLVKKSSAIEAAPFPQREGVVAYMQQAHVFRNPVVFPKDLWKKALAHVAEPFPHLLFIDTIYVPVFTTVFLNH